MLPSLRLKGGLYLVVLHAAEALEVMKNVQINFSLGSR